MSNFSVHPASNSLWSRRQLLKMAGGCGAMSSAPMLSTIFNMSLMKSIASAQAPVNDFKALVCVFLDGGNDAYNMLYPADATPYNDYVTVRGVDVAKPLNPSTQITGYTNRLFNLHPGMEGVKSMYDSGKLAVVNNIGSLVRNATTTSNYNQTAYQPKGLFSHSDEQRNWQTGVPGDRTRAIGWAGRIADLMRDTANQNASVAMGIALDSLNIFQTGITTFPYVITTGGAGGAQSVQLSGYNGTSSIDRIYTRATNSALETEARGLLVRSFSRARRDAIDTAVGFNQAVANVTFTTTFPTSSLGTRLKAVAATIASAPALGQNRQIFFVSTGGWDNHDDLVAAHNNLLPNLSNSLKAFHDALVEKGLLNDVMCFTASDFCRTLTINGDGSDHAWGSHQFVFGGAVNGGQMYGDYPQSLISPVAQAKNLDVGRGRLIPTTSVDEYAAEMALWFGIPSGQLLDIFPNLNEFYTPGGGKPIGFTT